MQGNNFRKAIFIGLLMLTGVGAVYAAGLSLGLSGAVKRKGQALEKKVTEKDEPGVASFGVTGSVVKGPVSGATVTFYALNANGTKGREWGAGTTGTDGTFSIALNDVLSASPFYAESMGGSYREEASGSTVALGAADMVSAVLPAGTRHVVLSVLTHMAAERAKDMAAAGIPLDQAVDSANAGVEMQYRLGGIVGTRPATVDDPAGVGGASLEQRNYGLVLAGLSQEAATLNVRTIDLAQALADDISDGILDGLKNGNPIPVPVISGGSIPLSAAAGIQDLQTGTSAFVGSSRNHSGIPRYDIPLTPMEVGINTAGALYIRAVLPAWHTLQAGSAPLTAFGGTPPYHWVFKSGNPGWLSITDAGVLSGIAPLISGSMEITPPFTVTVSDSAGHSRDLELNVTILQAPPSITTVGPVALMVGTPASVNLVGSVSGGVPPYYYTKGSGSTPMGMSVDLNGNLVGTPVTAGVYTFEVCVVDLVGSTSCQSVTVQTAQPVFITGCPSAYDGTYTGQFNYEYQLSDWYDDPLYIWVPRTPVTGSLTVSVTLQCFVVTPGVGVAVYETHASASDPTFGCTGGCVLSGSQMVILPDALPTGSANPSLAGTGIMFSFPNGLWVMTNNDTGFLNVSPDGKTIYSSPDSNATNDAWYADDSGPSGIYPTAAWDTPVDVSLDYIHFTSWSLTRP